MGPSATNSFQLVKSQIVLSEYMEKEGVKFPKKRSHQKNIKAFCPFHDDKNNPSLSVNDSEGLWFCFTCSGDTGGSVIDFWLKMNPSATESEAVSALAQECGIILPEYKSSGVSLSRVRAALDKVQKAATDLLFGDEDSNEAQTAFEYLEERKMNLEVAESWKYGFLPSGFDAVDFILDSCSDERAAIEAGILLKNADQTLWSPIHGRIIIPISDERGQTIGLSGRKVPGIKSSGPKFINPPDTLLYKKSQVLYGMDLIGKTPKRIVVVEGYFDTMAVQESGAGIGVATCGVHMTPDQAKLLSRAEEVVFMFDPDSGGAKGIIGSLWISNILGDKAKAVMLDSEGDPWDIYTSDGADKLVQYAQKRSVPLIDAGTRTKYVQCGDDSEFDRWIAQTSSTLKETHHIDSMLRIAAQLRNQSVSKYIYGLPTSTLPHRRRNKSDEASVESNENTVSIDFNMKSLVRRIMQMEMNERRGVLAPIKRWSGVVDGAIRNWFPVSTEADIVLFSSAILGAASEKHDPKIDRLLASMIYEDNGKTEDISLALRNIIMQMQHGAYSMLDGTFDIPESLAIQLSSFRNLHAMYQNIEMQLEILTYLLDLSLDLELYKNSVERGTKTAA